MGHWVQSYSLDELNRVSVPGHAVPRLFMAIPVGRWPHDALQHLGRTFLEGQGPCASFGLLLSTDNHYWQADVTPREARKIETGVLSDLLTHDSETSVGLPRDASGLLILGGAYPQPGWGVFLRSRGSSTPITRNLDGWVERSLDQADPEHRREVIQRAIATFKAWEEVRGRKPPSLHQPESLVTLQESYKASVDARMAIERLVRGKVPVTDGWPVVESHLGRMRAGMDLGHQARLNAYAKRLQDLCWIKECLRDEPGFDYGRATAEASKMQGPELKGFYSALPDGGVRKRVAAWVRTLHRSPGLGPGDIEDWCSREEAALNAIWSEIAGELKAAYSAEAGAWQAAQGEHDRNKTNWEARTHRLESEFRRELAQSAAVQWDLGPRLLQAMELGSGRLSHGVEAIPLSWDPARMIGWKLSLAHADIQLGDLQDAARGFLQEGDLDPGECVPTDAINGSAFADYVHFLSISDPARTPREMTVNMVDRLLGLPGIRRILREERGGGPMPPAPEVSADALVAHWGWKKPTHRESAPLAKWIQRLRSGRHQAIRPDFNGIRKSLESYLKDLLTTVFYMRGSGEGDILDWVQRHLPSAITSGGESWETIRGNLTVGAAERLLMPLLQIQFSGNPGACEDLHAALGELRRLLNVESHDSAEDGGTVEMEALPELLQKVQDATTALVDEMPWHLIIHQRIGNQPIVVTGLAWSHGYPEPRLIRVLVNADQALGHRMLIWNPTKLNPVMADAKVLAWR